MQSPMKTSWSQVNIWNRCKRAHHYRYVERIQRRRPRVPMLRGKILHDMLHNHTMTKIDPSFDRDAWDALEKYETQYKRLFAEEREEYGDIPGECGRIFTAYLRRYRNDGLTYEGSEEYVETELAKGLIFEGYIDKRARDKNGRRWILDHKFMSNIPGPEERFHELQLVVYVWAWNRFNPKKPIDGVCWDYAKTTPPTEPQLLKNGELSKRKNIRCDRATYEAAIKQHGLKKKDYESLLKTLDENNKMFFERVFLPAPSKAMMQNVIEDLRTTSVLIHNLRGIAPRSMSKFNCMGCEFRELCEAEVRGLDAKFVRKSKFQSRESSRGEEN